jgi:two-component sensor histidine kinase
MARGPKQLLDRLRDYLNLSKSAPTGADKSVLEDFAAACAPETLCEKLLDAAIVLMRSDAASVQLLDPDRKRLRLLASRGFAKSSARFWQWVNVDAQSSCGRALAKKERIVVGDIEADAALKGTADGEAYRASGLKAVQSTPLIARDGRLLGMLSTHWSKPHEPDPADLRHFDVLARQAADLLERVKFQEALSRSEERLRKRAAEALPASEHHAQTLLAELQHRLRNTLAVVRSIAVRTAENSTNVEDMLLHFQGRLDAFARVQAALTRNPEGKVDLACLVEDELVAHAAREGEQVSIDGPNVRLGTKAAECLALAVHELTTNAVKYGALMSDHGHVRVGWKTDETPDGGQFTFRWKENGAELKDRTIKREGFGMDLLRRSLPYDLHGEIEIELEPDGLRFELRMPLSASSFVTTIPASRNQISS